MRAWDSFSAIWVVDFEFVAPPGNSPGPVVCLVAFEVLTGRTVRVWQDQLIGMREPPYGTGPDVLLIAYFASAEIGCHLSLGWSLPEWTLDLYCEFRTHTNGLRPISGNGLLGALVWCGIGTRRSQEKQAARELILRGGPWNSDEQREILDYCEADVIDTTKLLEAMRARINLPQALLRGRFMRAAARIEATGIPVDVGIYAQLVERWPFIQDRLIERVDKDFGVFDGRTFKQDRWAKYLEGNRIPWPRTPTGRLALDDATFREQARSFPQIAPIRELRDSLSQMRLSDLAIGRDGRNRVLLSPFGASSGRNTPSSSKFIFGPSVWLRSLIRPEPGRAMAYIDYSQQEFGVAAALSGDVNMLAAYHSGDPYLEFAKQAGAAPKDATKQTHGAVRDQFKACTLATQYGMGEESLAARIGVAPVKARELLTAHRRTYKTFWRWSDSAVDYAMTRGKLYTVFGWPVRLGGSVNPRSLRNFPMQANGAEMLRLACCRATENGVNVCAPVHDAILIEAATDGLDEAIAATKMAMASASVSVLGTLALRTDVSVIRYPDRYSDPRGRVMWDEVVGLLSEGTRRVNETY